MSTKAIDPVRLEAVKLHGAGYWVIAIRPAGEVYESRGGKRTATGKEPIGSRWGEERWTVGKLELEFKRHPGAGGGICLGPGRAPNKEWLFDVERDGEDGEIALSAVFDGEIPQTKGWGSTRGRHSLFWATHEETIRLLEALNRYGTEGKGTQAGVWHMPGAEGLELRIGGYKDADRSIVKQVQSVIPPTPGTNGQPREWNGVTEVLEWPSWATDRLEEMARAAVDSRAAAEIAEAKEKAPRQLPNGKPRKRRLIVRSVSSRIERAIKYLEKADAAISGQGGHNTTFRVACAVGPGFDLTEEECFELLRDHYNSRCEPPWSNAELEHKVQEAYKVETRRGWILEETRGTQGDPPRPLPAGELATFANYDLVEGQDGKPFKQSVSLATLSARLEELLPGWPKRVGVDDTLFVEGPNHRAMYLNSSTRLFAWIGKYAAVDWASSRHGGTFIPQDRFFEHLRMTAQHFDAIETQPHFPAPLPNVYYMHTSIGCGDGAHLEELLNYFRPMTQEDRQLIRAMILTVAWGGPPGSRPAFLVTGPDNDPKRGRGVGKSRLAHMLASIYGGSIDVCPTDQIADVKTRLLSDSARQIRLAILDNVKLLKFSWGDLEGLITGPDISGRMLFKGEGRRPNSLVWAITLNGASLSTDMAQRVICIRLKRPDYRPDWEEAVREFIRAHREQILADVRAAFEEQPREIQARTRWALWEREVLGRCAMANLLQDAILQRQATNDDDEEEAAVVATFISQKLSSIYKLEASSCHVFIPSHLAAGWLNEATNQKLPVNKASAYLASLAIPEIRKATFNSNRERGWNWIGSECPADAVRRHINQLSQDQEQASMDHQVVRSLKVKAW